MAPGTELITRLLLALYAEPEATLLFELLFSKSGPYGGLTASDQLAEVGIELMATNADRCERVREQS